MSDIDSPAKRGRPPKFRPPHLESAPLTATAAEQFANRAEASPAASFQGQPAAQSEYVLPHVTTDDARNFGFESNYVDYQVTRESRRPFGAFDQKLALLHLIRPGYRGFAFLDRPGRIDAARAAGYTLVKGNDGRNVTVPGSVNTDGTMTRHFLMEIPEEWYQEDMAREQREIDEKEKAIKRGAASREADDGRYVPMRPDGRPVIDIRKG